MSGARPLSASFYERDAEEVARDLLGTILVSEIEGHRCSGRIVETEAYTGPHDPASHAAASIGRTRRNDPMFGPPGSAYIHLNYGIHWCLNAVSGPEGYPAAVLIRALEPVEGMQAMVERRGRERPNELCSGPGKLTQALGIGPELQRHPLERLPLCIEEGDAVPAERIARVPRVGITLGADSELRFYELGSEHVSRR